MKPYKRKLTNLIIEPSFQLRFLLFLIGVSLLPVFLSSAFISYFLRKNYLLLVDYGALDPEITSLLMQELKTLIGSILATFFGFLLCIAVLGVLFSHRIAGVIYALRRTFNQAAEGRDVRLHFRKRDEFQELADSFNRMMETLKSKTPKKKQLPESL